MKLILTGFMGSGKTTVGKLLAQNLNFRFMDTDQEIIQISGNNSVAEIFEKYGETRFRELETNIAIKISKQTENYVVSTGGGMIISTKNFEIIKTDAKIIYLKTNFETIKERVEIEIIEKNLIRPLFSNIADARNLYDQRKSVYETNSDCLVVTDDKSPVEIVNIIVSLISHE